MLTKVNWKKSLIVSAMTAVVFVGSTQPIFAAENFFQRTQRSISNTVDGLYLKLPGKKPGKLVVKQMSESYKKLKSFESDTTIDIQISGEGQQVGTAQLKLSGPTVVGEFWNPQTYKQEMKVNGNVSFEGTTLSAAAEVKMLDGISYFKITQLPSLPGVNLDQMKNQWVKVDPASQGVNAEETTLTAEQQQKMQAAFLKMLEGSEVSEAKPEKKDNVDVYVVTMTISKPAVVDYIVTATEIQRESMKNAATTEAQKMALENQTPEMTKQSLEKAMEAIGDIRATVWVERKNYYPKHFELPIDVNLEKVAPGVSQGSATSPKVDKLQVKIVADTRKFNESFTITVPEGAEDAETFFQKMMGSSMAPGMVPSSVPSSQMNRRPSTGTSELPEMTEYQRMQLEQYEKELEELESMGY